MKVQKQSACCAAACPDLPIAQWSTYYALVTPAVDCVRAPECCKDEPTKLSGSADSTAENEQVQLAPIGMQANYLLK